MTIRADELALRDLVQERLARVATKERTHVAELLDAGQVIPRHSNGMEEAAAIGAWAV
jgi:hypothetical protein